MLDSNWLLKNQGRSRSTSSLGMEFPVTRLSFLTLDEAVIVHVKLSSHRFRTRLSAVKEIRFCDVAIVLEMFWAAWSWQFDIARVIAQDFFKVRMLGLRVYIRLSLNPWLHPCYSSPSLHCQIQGCAHIVHAYSHFGPHLCIPLQATARNWMQQQKWRQGQLCR